MAHHPQRSWQRIPGRWSAINFKRMGIRQSTTRGGCPADNAHAESFFHSMKADRLHGVAFADEQALRRCVAGDASDHNHQRLHSSLGYRSPVAYERQAA